ncbi:MAG: AMP phosphorylase [Candidatus Methanomethylophilaceae archaeon]|nr:AMP phosphorylase [Candidatus Methanomethylophilaceae archaeon]
MKLKCKLFDMDVSEPSVMLHDDDCIEIGVREGDRVKIAGSKTAVAIAAHSDTLLERGTIYIPFSVSKVCGVRDGDEVSVTFSTKPDSVRSIRKKMDGEKLDREEIHAIVEDILENRLTKIEVSAWLTALYINGMDISEIADFTVSMAETGDMIKFEKGPVFDFHSLGGVPGNKITPIVVSIVAAAGIMIPKTSSRAISSACGTSDFVETFCNVELDAESLKEITQEIGGVFSWGGSMNLAPVDDMVIKVEHPLGINPRPQMLASIMSKKLAIGTTHLVVDIPTGAGTKVETLEAARGYAQDLMQLGEKIGMHVECAITYADQPIGYAVGPNLEARECISILEGSRHPSAVVEKACDCAGIILEIAGIPNGGARAREILDSGDAYRKFMEIVVAQGGRPDLKSEDLKPGQYSYELRSPKTGYIHSIKKKDVVSIAKAAGAPSDKGAGIVFAKKKGQRVEEGDLLLTIYADNEAKLKRARDAAARYFPMDIEGMLIKRVSPLGIR